MYIYIYIYIYTHTRIYVKENISCQGQETFLASAADKQTETMTQSDQTTIPPYQP